MSSYLTTSSASATYQTISGMSSYLTSATASSTYQTISGMSSYLTTSSASSTYQPLLSYDSAPTSGSTNIVRSGGIFSALSNYLTTATASATYQTISGMSSYLTTATASTTYSTLAGNNTITGARNYTNQTAFSRVLENVTSGSITSNILTIDFSSNNSVVYVTPSANFTVKITNLPSGTQTNSYTFTIWSTAKFYATTVQVGGTAQTLLAVGGASNLASSVNASATNLLQQVTLIYVNSTTPTRVLTSLASIF
jgi:hypothetical protein